MSARLLRLAHCALSAVVVLVALVLLVPQAPAQVVEGPRLEVDRTSVAPGGSVVVTLTGWRTKVVTLAVCGNNAVRGSTDCNVTASEGIGLRRDIEVSTRDFYVNPPPTPCPCVLRASSPTNDEVAIAPIEVHGHPVGPIVYPHAYAPLEVSVDAEKAPHGVVAGLRALLGGPTSYDVTVSVRNASTEPVRDVVLAGAAGRAGSDLGALAVPIVDVLAPGQTWTHTVRSTLPAPVVGSFVFRVTATGAGESVEQEAHARSMPIVLLLLVAVLAVDVAAVVWRRRALARADRNVSHRSGRSSRVVQPLATRPS